jgi:hypothetical protein
VAELEGQLATSQGQLATSQEEVQTLRVRVRELEEASAVPAAGRSVGLAELVKQAKASREVLEAAHSRERHDKFAGTTFTLAYTSLSAFFGGLEARIGPPNPNLRVAMRAEHCDSADSADEYTTSNCILSGTRTLVAAARPPLYCLWLSRERPVFEKFLCACLLSCPLCASPLSDQCSSSWEARRRDNHARD